MQKHYQPSPGIGIIQAAALRLKVKRLQATYKILQVQK
jgi:hypothetical protein